MKRVITVVLLLLGGCISHRAPLAWQTVDMKNTSKEPQIYTINIISANKIFSAELPFCVEYYGRWALISTLWYGEQLAIDVNDSILRFPYAQANEWVVHSLPSLQFYGVLLVPADCPNEKQGLVCVARQGPGTNVPKLMASRDTFYEVPAIFPFHKDAKGNTTMVIRLVLWPGCTAKFKVNANCKLHITSIMTDTALIATHETVLKNRK
jgi:hypothetical protein